MIKTDFKSSIVLKKLERIEELINKLQKNYNYTIEFDNQVPNKYKLIARNNTFTFGTYQDVINALEFACVNELLLI